MEKRIGLGEDRGWKRWSVVLGPQKPYRSSWSLSRSPPPLAISASALCPSSVPCLSSAFQLRPGPNPSLSWLSSKPASRASFLSQQADHTSPDCGIEFRFKIKYELFSPEFDALHNSSLPVPLPVKSHPSRPSKPLSIPLKGHALSCLYVLASADSSTWNALLPPVCLLILPML